MADRNNWQCEMGVYPFMFASIKDFEPIVEKLIEVVIALVMSNTYNSH